MNSLKKLIHEAHRRSLWQVIGLFLATSWGVLQGVEFLTDFAGLPDWTPAMALVLLMIGLPICVATAFVQEGMPGQHDDGAPAMDDAAEAPHASDASPSEPTAAAAEPSGTRHFLTWRNAVLGGIGAFALLGFSLIAYFVMWSTGIGPVGNLVAQGVFEEGDAVLLADFTNTTSDASLAEVVTEALRVDLGTASTITPPASTPAR